MYKTLDIIDVMKRNSFVILTPLGDYCELNIPPETETGTIISVKGQGLYNRKTKKRGSLRVNISVKIPHITESNINDFIKRLKDDRH